MIDLQIIMDYYPLSEFDFRFDSSFLFQFFYYYPNFLFQLFIPMLGGHFRFHFLAFENAKKDYYPYPNSIFNSTDYFYHVGRNEEIE